MRASGAAADKCYVSRKLQDLHRSLIALVGNLLTGKVFHHQGSFAAGVSIVNKGTYGSIGRREAVGWLIAAGSTVLPLASSAQSLASFTPEAFGARGDGRTNDTAAFARMGEAVNQAGGGRIVLRRTVYLVGEQSPSLPGAPYAFAPRTILRLSKCERGVSIEGNGATLRCAPGLRYGTFDQKTGRSVELPMPNTRPGSLATPYDGMVTIEECRGAVTITDLELDGNVGAHRIGGPWGDTGRQIPCDGLFLRDNHGDEIVRNLHSHHHARDGVGLAGLTLLGRVRRSFVGIRSEWNGRQGCSLIGGSGYAFTGCRFAHTGRGPLSTPPAAGFDIEAESGQIRNVRFSRCVFEDNVGCGLVADSGDSADVHLADCRFVGTTSWSTWTNKPGFRFDRCEIVGACVRFFSSPNPMLATRFYDCIFTDAPARSANHKVYLNGSMANVSDSRNVLFARCRFDATHGAQLPWSTAAIYESCTMRQTGTGTAYPRGQFRGVNRIDGPVDIAASTVSGRMIINGRTIPPRS